VARDGAEASNERDPHTALTNDLRKTRVLNICLLELLAARRTAVFERAVAPLAPAPPVPAPGVLTRSCRSRRRTCRRRRSQSPNRGPTRGHRARLRFRVRRAARERSEDETFGTVVWGTGRTGGNEMTKRMAMGMRKPYLVLKHARMSLLIVALRSTVRTREDIVLQVSGRRRSVCGRGRRARR
jgi:hypothetical protein